MQEITDKDISNWEKKLATFSRADLVAIIAGNHNAIWRLEQDIIRLRDDRDAARKQRDRLIVASLQRQIHEYTPPWHERMKERILTFFGVGTDP